MLMKAKVFFLSLGLLFSANAAFAQDETAGAANSAELTYVILDPAFIVTFGGPGPLKYLKAEVALRVPVDQAEANVKLHKPAIRHTLVMLLSRQESKDVATAEAREHLRQVALEEIRNLMVDEYGSAGYDMIKNLRFTSFIVQE